jgi:hypothetical protein
MRQRPHRHVLSLWAHRLRKWLIAKFLQQGRYLGAQFLACFLLLRRQLGDGVLVADAGEVGVFLPVLECLADAGVLLGIAGDLGPVRIVGSSFKQTISES